MSTLERESGGAAVDQRLLQAAKIERGGPILLMDGQRGRTGSECEI